jgi:hypothetical protein
VTGGLSNEIKKHADGIGFLEADLIDEVGWPQSGGLQGPKLLVDVWSRLSPFDDKAARFWCL